MRESGCREEASRFNRSQRRLFVKANLRVNLPSIHERLQRSRGLTTAGLDARFSGWS